MKYFAQGLTSNHLKTSSRLWRVYACNICGGAVLASAKAAEGKQTPEGGILDWYPKGERVVDERIPGAVRDYLAEAVRALQVPRGCIMLCASAVDAMLKEKSLAAGTLFSRIGEALDAGLITEDMKHWAHEVRLDANEQRHADAELGPVTPENAERTLEFTMAIAEFMFVLPAKVAEGRRNAAANREG